jgi:hypothetical protein
MNGVAQPSFGAGRTDVLRAGCTGARGAISASQWSQVGLTQPPLGWTSLLQGSSGRQSLWIVLVVSYGLGGLQALMKGGSTVTPWKSATNCSRQFTFPAPPPRSTNP